MNTTKINTEISFPTVESKTNGFFSFILQLTFFGIIFFFFFLFVLGPLYGIYKRGFDATLPVLSICWSISLIILIPSLNHYIIKRRKIANKVVVNDTGLAFYNSKNEIVEQILYTELRPSKQNFDIYTVAPMGSGIAPLLEITIQQEKQEETTRRIDMNLPMYVVKNKLTLYAHFMQGITVFRPDLKIDPLALRNFSIDPVTLEVSKKGTSLGGWLLILAVLIVSAMIVGIAFLL